MRGTRTLSKNVIVRTKKGQISGRSFLNFETNFTTNRNCPPPHFTNIQFHLGLGVFLCFFFNRSFRSDRSSKGTIVPQERRPALALTQKFNIIKTYYMSQMNPNKFLHILSSTTIHCRSLPLNVVSCSCMGPILVNFFLQRRDFSYIFVSLLFDWLVEIKIKIESLHCIDLLYIYCIDLLYIYIVLIYCIYIVLIFSITTITVNKNKIIAQW